MMYLTQTQIGYLIGKPDRTLPRWEAIQRAIDSLNEGIKGRIEYHIRTNGGRPFDIQVHYDNLPEHLKQYIAYRESQDAKPNLRSV